MRLFPELVGHNHPLRLITHTFFCLGSSAGGVSPSFEKVKTLMRSDACQARGHYGKAGLFSPAQHGNWTQEDVNYFKNSFASTWPAFAAIANQLDPGKKFADVHNLFRT